LSGCRGFACGAVEPDSIHQELFEVAMSVEAQKETLGFQTEVRQLLDLMIHSLYSNKEIFLRELISNASDAADKLRFEALSNDALYEGDGDLQIQVRFDKDARTVTVSDNGIGMSRDEVVEHIGTIAKSGTRQFFQSLTGDDAKDARLIGQFGVGFYSSFIVADRATLTTRRAGCKPEEAVRWESAGEGEFTVATTEKMSRGTEIVLHLREGEDEFLDEFRLRDIVHKYSEHISWPIRMAKEGGDDETVNSATALWALNKSEISDEEYAEFYKHVAHDFEAPLAHVHSRVEGNLEYTSLLYIPARAPFDLWDRERRHGVKLYVRRVFIMEDTEQLMPSYLRFVRGVIDSADLPLNISREILQQNRQIESIRTASVKRVLGVLGDMSRDDPEKYAKFWAEFGRVLKEGVVVDHKNQETIAKLLRFATTRSGSDAQEVSLDDYLGRMQEGQDKIYYVTADTYARAKSSPHLEVFRKKDVEVLLLTEEVDEWLVSHLTEYQGKALHSVAKGDLDLGEVKDESGDSDTESAAEDYEDLLKRLKDKLGERVKEVRLSQRLTASPACLVAEEHGLGAHMERLLKQAGQKVPASAPILELNPDHSVIARLKRESDDQRIEDWAHVLFDQALLSEGGQPEDPAEFVRRTNALFEALT
jgi:molecular chaperone HtpG